MTIDSNDRRGINVNAIRGSALLLAVLAATGCESTRHSVVEDPFLEGPTTAIVAPLGPVAAKSQPDERIFAARANGPEADFARDTRSHRASPPVRNTAGTAIVPVTFTPAEPRVCPPKFHDAPCPAPHDLAGGGPDLPALPPAEYLGPYDPHDYSDEYLCDGGDRANPVHYDAFNRLGLDTEDTVAEFVDDDGEPHVKPTNRVCVYAPRFAAIRTVDMPSAEGLVRGPSLEARRLAGAGIRTRLAVTQHAQREAGVGVRVRSRASGVDADVNRDDLDQVAHVAGHTKLVNTFENIRFLRSGRIEQEDRPLLAKAMEAAVTWSQDRSPIAVASTVGGQEVRGTFEVHQIIGLDESLKKPGELRIVKLADKQSAQRGDVVTFTIRYDNLGDEPLHHLRIVDNLTPRLEYVEDSGDSDRRGRLVVEENGEGSLVLTFEVDERIDGGTGGVISFEARVR